MADNILVTTEFLLALLNPNDDLNPVVRRAIQNEGKFRGVVTSLTIASFLESSVEIYGKALSGAAVDVVEKIYKHTGQSHLQRGSNYLLECFDKKAEAEVFDFVRKTPGVGYFKAFSIITCRRYGVVKAFSIDRGYADYGIAPLLFDIQNIAGPGDADVEGPDGTFAPPPSAVALSDVQPSPGQ